MRKSERMKTQTELSDEECNCDIDEAEEYTFNHETVSEKTIKSTETKLISFTLKKYK